ncbi:PAS domain-containing protein [Rhodovibrionaceae bacterium A322]
MGNNSDQQRFDTSHFSLPERRWETWPETLAEPLQTFWDYCNAIRDPQSGELHRSAFDPQAIAPLLCNVQIIEALPKPTGEYRYRWRLSGTEFRKYYGHDLTGCFMDEFYPADVLREINRAYGNVIANGEPHFLRSRDAKMAERELYSYDRIVLPFLMPDGPPQLIGYWHWYPNTPIDPC